MATKKLKAYIAAPATVDTTPIRDFLHREGVASNDAYSIAAGSDLVDALVRRIRAADFAVAVLNEDVGWTAYELGLCDALAKPVLLIASPAFSAPASIAPHPLVRTSIVNSDVWQLALRKFVQDVRGDRARPGHVRQQRPQGEKSNSRKLLDLAEKIHAERGSASPSRVQELTLELFRAASVMAVAQEPELANRGADFAVWDDGLAHSVGLPLFVEVKVGRLNGQRLKDAERRLSEAMRASSGRLGLLLYLDNEGRRFPTPTWDIPFIVRFELEDFARDLSRRPFAALVVEQRNKLVHGMG